MLSASVKEIHLEKKLLHHGKLVLSFRKFGSTTQYQKSFDEYQYMQRSKIPTMHFQKSLPHLQVPNLRSTCDKYLRAQQPLLSTNDFDKTTSYVAEFASKEGIHMQKQLKAADLACRNTNYVSKYWYDMYLRDRKPIPINYNPILVLDQQEDVRYNDQLVKATNVVVSSLRFMKSLQANILDPEVYYMKPDVANSNTFRIATKLVPSVFSAYVAMAFKAFPLDMSQYHNLFCSTRIPEVGKDKIFEAESARHIVVMRKGHFYGFDVLDENGYIVEAKEIAANLKYILEDNVLANTVPIGILTAGERNEWAKTRKYLEEIGNSAVLKIIDSAIFILNLDDEEMGSDYIKLIRSYLHADGKNRWFDKSMSLIVTKDGYTGVNFEHSWGDGVAVLRFIRDLKKDITINPKFQMDEISTLDKRGTNVFRLEFSTDKRIEAAVDVEQKNFNAWINRLCIDYLIYNGFGKEQCKQFGVSPDAVMQLSFQLAIYNQRGHLVPTYESCSTAVFKHGRTETLRPCTMQTKALCIALANRNKSQDAELKSLIKNCSEAHLKLMKEAMMGKGFDRHLFVLKRMIEDSNQPLPDIFKDAAYETINRNILSTSTLSAPEIIAGGFGPTVSEGYGIGYMIQNNRLGAVVTSYKEHCNASDFVNSLQDAYTSIHKVLTHK